MVKTIALFGFVTIAVANAAAAGEGEKYATRDPRTCASKTEPKAGAPSAEQAKAYLICGSAAHLGEGVDSFHLLVLMENVQVQVGAGRPFQGGGNSDVNMHDVDVKYQIYPIRGSFDMYQCANVAPGDPWQSVRDPKKNCNLYHETKAIGSCYKTTFGDWDCTMVDPTASIAASNIAGPQ